MATTEIPVSERLDRLERVVAVLTAAVAEAMFQIGEEGYDPLTEQGLRKLNAAFDLIYEEVLESFPDALELGANV